MRNPLDELVKNRYASSRCFCCFHSPRSVYEDNLKSNTFFQSLWDASGFGKEILSSNWNYRGTVNAICPFTESSLYSPFSTYFLIAARGDIDTDGDGIPDGMEKLQFHTNPNLWDSSGDGLSDWMKIYRYGLDPLLRDTDGDGFEDDEEIRAGMNPSIQNNGAGTTIRYYYDDDDRLTGSYSGAKQGAATATLTPVGNPAVLHERRAE